MSTPQPTGLSAAAAGNLAERLRHHVLSRGGPAKDDDGNPVVPNGAWTMMLEAADELDRLDDLEARVNLSSAAKLRFSERMWLAANLVRDIIRAPRLARGSSRSEPCSVGVNT